jgi:histidine triad (HIT) family protein
MDECVFCRIAKGELPSKKVYEDSHSIAFLDINPRNPGHAIVVPRKHSQDIFSIPEAQAAELMKAVRRVAIGVRKATGAKGISISQSNGQLAGQRMPHIHFHVIPRTEAEKGVGFDEVIPMKKAEESDLVNMAKKISAAVPKSAPRPEAARKAPKEAPREPKPEPVKPTEDAPKEEQAQDDDPRSPDRQKIDFDF